MKWVRRIALGLFATFALLIVIGLIAGPKNSRPMLPAAVSEHSKPVAEPQVTHWMQARQKVSLQKLTWTVGGFGQVAKLSFSISNQSTFDIKDPVVSCFYFGESGTKIGATKSPIYQQVAAGSTKKISDFNAGFIDPQSRNAQCWVDDFKL